MPLNTRDYVDLGSFYRISFKPVVLELRLNMLNQYFFCLDDLIVIREERSIVLNSIH